MLRLGVMCTIGPLRFVSFLTRFRAAHPGVEISVLEDGPDRLCTLLEKGEIDVALLAHRDGAPSSFQSQFLYCERFVIACVERILSRAGTRCEPSIWMANSICRAATANIATFSSRLAPSPALAWCVLFAANAKTGYWLWSPRAWVSVLFRNTPTLFPAW